MNNLYTFINNISPLQENTWLRVEKLFSKKSLVKGAYFITDGEYANQIGFLESCIIRAFYRNTSCK
jgi:hypothetical protein